MTRTEIKEHLTQGTLTLTDVIDAVIELNGIIGVGCITLGDDIQAYCYERNTHR
jgi:hypothetical protein